MIDHEEQDPIKVAAEEMGRITRTMIALTIEIKYQNQIKQNHQLTADTKPATISQPAAEHASELNIGDLIRSQRQAIGEVIQLPPDTNMATIRFHNKHKNRTTILDLEKTGLKQIEPQQEQ